MPVLGASFGNAFWIACTRAATAGSRNVGHICLAATSMKVTQKTTTRNRKKHASSSVSTPPNGPAATAWQAAAARREEVSKSIRLTGCRELHALATQFVLDDDQIAGFRKGTRRENIASGATETTKPLQISTNGSLVFRSSQKRPVGVVGLGEVRGATL